MRNINLAGNCRKYWRNPIVTVLIRATRQEEKVLHGCKWSDNRDYGSSYVDRGCLHALNCGTPCENAASS